MRIFYMLVTIIFCVVIYSGCSTYKQISTSPDYMASEEYQSRKEIKESLFKEDQEVMSNEEIEKILSVRVKLPDKSRIVVYRAAYPWDSTESVVPEQFAAKLKSCKRISDVSVLPTLLIPKKLSIPYLREAAARMQADFMLLYKARSDTYRTYKIITKDDVKAYASVEVILIDTRTGVIIFSSVLTETTTVKETSEEIRIAETIEKAKQLAFSNALLRVADDLVKFFESVP